MHVLLPALLPAPTGPHTQAGVVSGEPRRAGTAKKRQKLKVKRQKCGVRLLADGAVAIYRNASRAADLPWNQRLEQRSAACVNELQRPAACRLGEW
jgi:hypothetical protein